MSGFLKPYQVEQIKKRYPVGTRIQLDHMEGERDMPDGLRGMVKMVDDQGQLHMRWENGRSLALVPNVDSFHVLPPEQEHTTEKTEEPDMDNDKMNLYVDYINKNVLPKINYDRLQADYGTEEKAYAKSVLNALHKGVSEVYGTEAFGRETAGGYVLLPGVVQSQSTGNVCVVLLELDLQSSGEHCGTDFLIRYGCVNQFEEEMPGKVRKFLHDQYGAYDYGYTAVLTDDIHVDKSKLPQAMKEVLDNFKEYEFVPCDPKNVIGNVNDRPDWNEDLER